MKEGINFDKLSLEELEKLHLEVHALFSKTLRGEAKEWSFRKLFVLHKEISAALIRTGGKHIAPVDQLDNLEIYEEGGVLKSKITYEEESEIIKENKKKPEAFKKHKFKPAFWTHPNGHPRCLICGDEELMGGICNNPNPPYAKIELEQSKTRFKLKHDWWKEQFVIKGLPVEHWSMKFKTKDWQYFTLNKNLLTVETGITGIKKKGNQTLYELKGIIPPGRNLNPNKKISMHIDDIDDGIVDIIKDSENEMRVNFSGKKLKGIWIFKRSDLGSNVWSVSKGELPKAKLLSREFGAPLSDEEIHDLYFLSENKVGVSEIGRLLERPNSTIYEWKEKLSI